MFEDEASLVERHIRSLTELLKELRQRTHLNRQGIAGETSVRQAVERVLVDLGNADWHVLIDRRWPGTRRANLDVLLVGPPGVLILDAKNWHDPRIENNCLFNGDADATDQIDKVRGQSDAVAEALAGLGLAPTAVIPVLVLAKRKLAARDLDGVRVVGESNLQAELVRLPIRLSHDDVAEVVAAVDEACPPMNASLNRSTRVITPSKQSPPAPQPDTGELFDIESAWEGLLAAACAQPIESWMTWLHPAQAQLATRNFTGPARVRGAAGTGKTVVALNRASHLSRRPDSRVLVTSFVRTLPVVQQSIFQRLAPMSSQRVEFLGMHAWAARFLSSRGVTFDLGPDGRGAENAFARSWSMVGSRGALAQVGASYQYWRDEIAHVIKGRGLTEVGDYLELDRIGRRTPLREDRRLAVWELYEDYKRRMAEAGYWDWEDVMTAARDSATTEPLVRPYTSVIVDEVQDLTCEGLRLLHALVGDRENGLFIVGDGQQSVYPGGFALVEAGVNVVGRSSVLTRNYRNAGEVIRTALEVVRDDDFDDLEEKLQAGSRECEVQRDGGQVHRFDTVDQRSQREGLIIHVRWLMDQGIRPGDMAVLVSTNRGATDWKTALHDAAIPTESLLDYDGTTSDRVKVGTYQRAKGLEFAAVFIPDYDRAITEPRAGESRESANERNELERRCLFVAMTRARDSLWLGSVAALSP
jgi:hypothetical protein